MTMIVGLFLIAGVVRLFSRGYTGDAYDEYRHDPYYYYPHTPGPPVQMGGYYHTPPHYPSPYYDYAPRYIQPAIRPEYARASGFGSLLTTIAIVSALFFLGVKADLIQLTINIGRPPDSEYRRNHSNPALPDNQEDPSTYVINR